MMSKIINYFKEHKAIGSILGGVIMFCALLVMINIYKNSISNQVIDFKETGTIFEYRAIEDEYVTYITVNADGYCNISMWPDDERVESYPDIDFQINEQQINELKDILNRYRLSAFNQVVEDDSGTEFIIIKAKNDEATFSNANKSDNMEFIIKFVKENLVPQDIMNEYNDGVAKYFGNE